VVSVAFKVWSFGDAVKLDLLEPLKVHQQWLEDEMPKRSVLIDALLDEVHCTYIDRITTFNRNHKGQDWFKVANFKHKLNVAIEAHLKILKQILLKIDLESICAVDSFYDNSCRRAALNTCFQNEKAPFRKGVCFADVFDISRDVEGIIKHLGGDSGLEVTESLESDVDAFIERFFRPKDNGLSREELTLLHGRVRFWARKCHVPFTKESDLTDVFDRCFDWLIDSDLPIEGSIKEDWFGDNMRVWFVVAHALCESQKIKVAQRVKNSEHKRAKAFDIWESNYRNKTAAERRILKVSQRSISVEVGVSVGKLNSWFKEFEINS
tara:strand:+ start:1327 stop:2295 length:969 start_codon:yes stop_codon:yes gene_type:complete